MVGTGVGKARPADYLTGLIDPGGRRPWRAGDGSQIGPDAIAVNGCMSPGGTRNLAGNLARVIDRVSADVCAVGESDELAVGIDGHPAPSPGRRGPRNNDLAQIVDGDTARTPRAGRIDVDHLAPAVQKGVKGRGLGGDGTPGSDHLAGDVDCGGL